MRSVVEGLSAADLVRYEDVRNFGRDPELGSSNLQPGAGMIYRPDYCGCEPPQRVSGFVQMATTVRRQVLGPAKMPGSPPTRAARGFPPTAPPAGKSAAAVPPAWQVGTSPDEELRTGSPTRGYF